MTKLQTDIIEKILNRFSLQHHNEDGRSYFKVKEYNIHDRLYVCVWMEETNLFAGKFVLPHYMISDIHTWDISDPNCDFTKIAEKILTLCRESPLEWEEEK